MHTRKFQYILANQIVEILRTPTIRNAFVAKQGSGKAASLQQLIQRVGRSHLFLFTPLPYRKRKYAKTKISAGQRNSPLQKSFHPAASRYQQSIPDHRDKFQTRHCT